METVKLRTVEGKEVECSVRVPTPRLLSEVEPVYREYEESVISVLEQRRSLLASLDAEDLKELAVIGQPSDDPASTVERAIRLARFLNRIAEKPNFAFVKYYIAVARVVVALPDGVQVDWEEQDIQELCRIFNLFCHFV